MPLFKRTERLPEEILLQEIDERHRLAEQIFHRREAAELSQEELAKRTHMTQAQIATLEAGHANPTLHTLVKVAHGLRVSVQDLFSEAGSLSGEDDYEVCLPNSWGVLDELLDLTGAMTRASPILPRNRFYEGTLEPELQEDWQVPGLTTAKRGLRMHRWGVSGRTGRERHLDPDESEEAVA